MDEDTYLLALSSRPPTSNHGETNFSTTMDAAARDTSHANNADTALENRRVAAVNPHYSILSLSRDEEEDDDDESSSLSEGIRPPPAIKRAFDYGDREGLPLILATHSEESVPADQISTVSTAPGPRHSSLLEQVTERFVDGLCFRGCHNKQVVAETNETNKVQEGHRLILEHEILEVLGCTVPPDQDEMDQVWTSAHLFCRDSFASEPIIPTPPRHPHRYSLRDRALRVYRLKKERAIPARIAGLTSPYTSPTSVLPRTARSMDERLLRESKGFDALSTLDEDLIHGEEELGYDSDPGEDTFLVHEPTTASSQHSPIQARSPSRLQRGETLTNERDYPGVIVQESFNLMWTLTWHPGPRRARGHPVAVNAWIERGTMVQDETTMLEPRFMWREAYQAELSSKRKLNLSTQKPFSVQLLNLCRIVNAPTNLEQSLYPLARASCSFILRTSDNEEYLFEAASTEQRDDIARRWKLCVARFASLAVIEDIATLRKEFFTPKVASQMLVPDSFD